MRNVVDLTALDDDDSDGAAPRVKRRRERTDIVDVDEEPEVLPRAPPRPPPVAALPHRHTQPTPACRFGARCNRQDTCRFRHRLLGQQRAAGTGRRDVVENPGGRLGADALQELEQESGRRVFTILQLRVHPSLVELKSKIMQVTSNRKREIDLTYVTSRGGWYIVSWKGQTERSGGLVTNIGIHFFDLLIWLFGDVQKSEVHLSNPTKACGFIELQNAVVRWYLSIDKNDLPADVIAKKQTTFRSITIDGSEIEFSGGFTDLHTVVYREILGGGGFGLEAARPSVALAHDIRNAKPIGPNDRVHPFAHKEFGR